MGEDQDRWRGDQAAPHARQGVPRQTEQGYMTIIAPTPLMDDATLKPLEEVAPSEDIA